MSTEDVILGVISLSPRSGYDIRTEFAGGAAGLLSALNFGSIYPRLKEMEDAGLVRSTEASVGRRKKRLYELTARGWEKLGTWLGAPTDYPFPIRDELLLKMIFWGAGRPEDRVTLIEHLEDRRAKTELFLRQLNAWPRNGESLVDEYGMLVYEAIRMRLETELVWLDRAVTQLQGPPQPSAQDPDDLVSRQRERRASALAAAEGPTNEAAAGISEEREDETRA